MYKEVPEDLMAKIKEAAETINKHRIDNLGFFCLQFPHDQSFIRMFGKYLSVADGGVCDEAIGRRKRSGGQV